MTSTDGSSDFTYDGANQLAGADHDYQVDESYTYDDNGNRTDGDYTTGPGNRLLSDGTYDYEYDNEGNLISRTETATGAVRRFEWDYRNRLVTVIDEDPTGVPVRRVDYTYDALDRRIAKSVDTTPLGALDAAITYSVYDGNQVLLEMVDSDGVSGPNETTLEKRYLHGPMVDQVLAQEDAGGNVEWLLGDHLGSIRDIVDNAGTIINHISYDSFGNVTAQTNPAVDTRYAFTGRELDPELGLYYYRARYYDAAIGRFISEDPSRFRSGDANLYRYVGNDPVNYRDPFGLKEQQTPTSYPDSPAYEPDRWNDPRTQYSTNCYAYAANDPDGHPLGTKPQPGEESGQMFTQLTGDNVAAAAERDGMTRAPGPVPKDGYYLVALVIAPGVDYHWYRQDNDGSWSHKPGHTKATNLDNSGNPITNPENADRGIYSEFYGYFYVPEGGIKTGP
jgi:RHS repeat-associated protein